MLKKSDLRSDQDRVITHLFEHDGVQVVVPMGGGKTVDALTAIREQIDERVIRHALVLAPKRVAQLVWPAERGKWEHLQNTTILLVDGPPAAREAKMKQLADVHVVGIDNLQWLVEYLQKLPLGHWHFDRLVIDELSRLKNGRSKRARALKKIIERFNGVWGFTGTPKPNGYEEQWNPLQIVSRKQAFVEPTNKTYDKFLEERFFSTDWNGYNLSIRMEWRDRMLADINRWTIAVDESEMPELPELSYIVDYVDLPPAVMKEYKRMEREAFARINEREIGAVNMAVATGKLAQMAQGFMYGDGNKDVEFIHTLKGDWLVDKVDSANGTPLLIAYEYQEDLRVIKELYPGIPWLGAGTTDKQAIAYERDWNAGKLELLAMHPFSAGHGLNLQDGGSQMALYGLTWSSEAYDQMIKRFHRTGQKRKSFAHLCLARNTVDEMKYMRVHDKMTQQDAFKAYIRRV